jgi:uroporphyrinogen-III decarboxylase
MEILNPEKIREKFENEIKESEKRREIAFSFKEPDRVPIVITAGGPYYSWLFGYDIKDYYENLEIQIEVQLKAINWRFQYLKDDNTSTSIYLDIGVIQEGLYFNCPIERPKGTTPWIVPVIENENDILKLKIPEPEDCQGIKYLEKRFDEFKKIAKKFGIEINYPGPRLQIHPPLSAACAIMEPTKVYEIMAVDKKLAKIFFDKMYLAFCKLVDYYDRKYKTKTESIGLANDNTCFISNKMYVEQVLHYDKSIYEKYGKKWRSLHTDGPSDHNFKTFADELKLNYMDIGGWSSIDFACKYMKGKVIIHGGLNNKDLYNGLDEKVKEKIKQAIKIAAPSGGYVFAIGGETYPGVAPETLIELVKYVKVVGKYPVNL